MKKEHLYFLIVLLFGCMPNMANVKKDLLYSDIIKNVLVEYNDSLQTLCNKIDKGNYNIKKNPYYYRLFVDPTIYESPITQVMSNTWESATDETSKENVFDYYDEDIERNNYLNHFFLNLYQTNPEMIVRKESDIMNQEDLLIDTNKEIKHESTLSDAIKNALDLTVDEPVAPILVKKPNFWKFTNKFSIQLMQYHVSDNWYQGGQDNNSVALYTTFKLDYDDQRSVTFENKLEMNIGFITNKGDTHHKTKTNIDLLRLTNKLGIKAFKHWNYAFSIESYTQFHPQFKSNSNVVISDFMSPFNLTASLGMDYKISKKKLTSLSVLIAPLSFNWKYVDRMALASRNGIDPNRHTIEAYGSSINLNMTFQLLKELRWTSRLKYFTNYKYTLTEWENTFDFSINKYLSTKLYVYPRFDDSVNKLDDTYMQLKEYLSLGINYSF